MRPRREEARQLKEAALAGGDSAENRECACASSLLLDGGAGSAGDGRGLEDSSFQQTPAAPLPEEASSFSKKGASSCLPQSDAGAPLRKTPFLFDRRRANLRGIARRKDDSVEGGRSSPSSSRVASPLEESQAEGRGFVNAALAAPAAFHSAAGRRVPRQRKALRGGGARTKFDLARPLTDNAASASEPPSSNPPSQQANASTPPAPAASFDVGESLPSASLAEEARKSLLLDSCEEGPQQPLPKEPKLSSPALAPQRESVPRSATSAAASAGKGEATFQQRLPPTASPRGAASPPSRGAPMARAQTKNESSSGRAVLSAAAAVSGQRAKARGKVSSQTKAGGAALRPSPASAELGAEEKESALGDGPRDLATRSSGARISKKTSALAALGGEEREGTDRQQQTAEKASSARRLSARAVQKSLHLAGAAAAVNAASLRARPFAQSRWVALRQPSLSSFPLASSSRDEAGEVTAPTSDGAGASPEERAASDSTAQQQPHPPPPAAAPQPQQAALPCKPRRAPLQGSAGAHSGGRVHSQSQSQSFLHSARRDERDSSAVCASRAECKTGGGGGQRWVALGPPPRERLFFSGPSLSPPTEGRGGDEEDREGFDLEGAQDLASRRGDCFIRSACKGTLASSVEAAEERRVSSAKTYGEGFPEAVSRIALQQTERAAPPSKCLGRVVLAMERFLLPSAPSQRVQPTVGQRETGRSSLSLSASASVRAGLSSGEVEGKAARETRGGISARRPFGRRSGEGARAALGGAQRESATQGGGGSPSLSQRGGRLADCTLWLDSEGRRPGEGVSFSRAAQLGERASPLRLAASGVAAAAGEGRFSGVPVLEPLNKALFFLREWNKTAAENIRLSQQHTNHAQASAAAFDSRGVRGSDPAETALLSLPAALRQPSSAEYSRGRAAGGGSASSRPPPQVFSKPQTHQTPLGSLEDASQAPAAAPFRDFGGEGSLPLGSLKGRALEAAVGEGLFSLPEETATKARCRRGEPAALRDRRLEMFFASLPPADQRLTALGAGPLDAFALGGGAGREGAFSMKGDSPSAATHKIQRRVALASQTPAAVAARESPMRAERSGSVEEGVQFLSKLPAAASGLLAADPRGGFALPAEGTPGAAPRSRWWGREGGGQAGEGVRESLEEGTRSAAAPEAHASQQSLPTELQSLLELAQRQLAAQQHSRSRSQGTAVVDLALLKTLAESLAREVRLQRELQAQLQAQLQRLVVLQLRECASQGKALAAASAGEEVSGLDQSKALAALTQDASSCAVGEAASRSRRAETAQERAAQVERLRQRVIWRLLDGIKVDRQALVLRQQQTGKAVEREAAPLQSACLEEFPSGEGFSHLQRLLFASSKAAARPKDLSVQSLPPQQQAPFLPPSAQPSAESLLTRECLAHLAALEEIHRHRQGAPLSESEPTRFDQISSRRPAWAVNSAEGGLVLALRSEASKALFARTSPQEAETSLAANPRLLPSEQQEAQKALVDCRPLGRGSAATSSERRALRALRLLQSPLWSWWLAALKKAWIRAAPILAGVSGDCLSLLTERLALLEVPFPLLAGEALAASEGPGASDSQAPLDHGGTEEASPVFCKFDVSSPEEVSDSEALPQLRGLEVSELLAAIVADGNDDAAQRDSSSSAEREALPLVWADVAEAQERGGQRERSQSALAFPEEMEQKALFHATSTVQTPQRLQERRSSSELRRRRLMDTLERQLEIKGKLFWLLERAPEVVVSLRCIDTSTCKLVRVVSHRRRVFAFAGNQGWSAEEEFREILQSALALAAARARKEAKLRRLFAQQKRKEEETQTPPGCLPQASNVSSPSEKNQTTRAEGEAAAEDASGEFEENPADCAAKRQCSQFLKERSWTLREVEYKARLEAVAREALLEATRLRLSFSASQKARGRWTLSVPSSRRAFAFVKALRAETPPAPFGRREGRRFLRSALRELHSRKQNREGQAKGATDENAALRLFEEGLHFSPSALGFKEGVGAVGRGCPPSTATPKLRGESSVMRVSVGRRKLWLSRRRRLKALEGKRASLPRLQSAFGEVQSKTRHSPRFGLCESVETAISVSVPQQTPPDASTFEHWLLGEDHDARGEASSAAPKAEGCGRERDRAGEAEGSSSGFSNYRKARRRRLSPWQLARFHGAETLWVAVPGRPMCSACGGFMRGLAVACTGEVGWLLAPPDQEGTETQSEQDALQGDKALPREQGPPSRCRCTYTPGGEEGFLQAAVASCEPSFLPTSNGESRVSSSEWKEGWGEARAEEASPSSLSSEASSSLHSVAEEEESLTPAQDASGCCAAERGEDACSARGGVSVGSSNGLALLALARVACRAGLLDRVTDSLLSHSATALSKRALRSRPALALLGFLSLLRDACVPTVAQQQQPFFSSDQWKEGAPLQSARPKHPLRRLVSRRLRQLLSALFRFCLCQARAREGLAGLRPRLDSSQAPPAHSSFSRDDAEAPPQNSRQADGLWATPATFF